MLEEVADGVLAGEFGRWPARQHPGRVLCLLTVILPNQRR